MGDTGLETLPGTGVRRESPYLLRSGYLRCAEVRSECDRECDPESFDRRPQASRTELA
jgi:hypothetical protein